jgi:hypothetical protein
MSGGWWWWWEIHWSSTSSRKQGGETPVNYCVVSVSPQGRGTFQTPNLSADGLGQKWIKCTHLRELKIIILRNKVLTTCKLALNLLKCYAHMEYSLFVWDKMCKIMCWIVLNRSVLRDLFKKNKPGFNSIWRSHSLFLNSITTAEVTTTHIHKYYPIKLKMLSNK